MKLGLTDVGVFQKGICLDATTLPQKVGTLRLK